MGLNERADQIINDLLYTNLSQKEIASKYGIGRTAVTAINRGQNHYREGLTYPLRDSRVTSKKIYMLDENKNVVQTFNNSIEAALYLGNKGYANGIRGIIGKNKKLYGYYWIH